MLLLGLAGFALGQRPHSKVRTTALFAKHPDGKLPSGNVIPVLFNVENGSDKPINVTVAWAHLFNPSDYSRTIHNFTGVLVGEVVHPGKDASFEYRVGIPPVKDQLEANFVALVEYTFSKSGDLRKSHNDILLNSTVTLEPVQAGFDLKDAASTAMGVATALAGLWMIKDLLFTPAAATSATGGKKGSSGDDDEDEDLRILATSGSSSSKSGGKRGASSASKSK